MKNILFVILDVGIMLLFCCFSLFAVKKTSKNKVKETNYVISTWKTIIYTVIALGTTLTSCYQTNFDLLFLNVIIVVVSTLEAISNNIESKELKKELDTKTDGVNVFISKENSIIHYIKKQGIDIEENIKEINLSLISQVRLHYSKENKENLKAKIICLESKKQHINNITFMSILTLTMSIVAIIITLLANQDSMTARVDDVIVANAINKSDEYNKIIEENRNIIYSYDNRFKKALDENDIEEIKNIENEDKYKEATDKIDNYTKERQEKIDYARKQIQPLIEKDNRNNIIIKLLFIVIIVASICSIIFMIINNSKKNENIAIDIHKSIIKEILEEKNNPQECNYPYINKLKYQNK